jgi:hypothetical protein
MSSEASSSGILTRGTSSRVSNGFAVTTITRGWSAEADKLLDYLVCLFDYLVVSLSRVLIPGERDF